MFNRTDIVIRLSLNTTEIKRMGKIYLFFEGKKSSILTEGK